MRIYFTYIYAYIYVYIYIYMYIYIIFLCMTQQKITCQFCSRRLQKTSPSMFFSPVGDASPQGLAQRRVSVTMPRKPTIPSPPTESRRDSEDSLIEMTPDDLLRPRGSSHRSVKTGENNVIESVPVQDWLIPSINGLYRTMVITTIYIQWDDPPSGRI